jgi:hypothetical protein
MATLYEFVHYSGHKANDDLPGYFKAPPISIISSKSLIVVLQQRSIAMCERMFFVTQAQRQQSECNF